MKATSTIFSGPRPSDFSSSAHGVEGNTSSRSTTSSSSSSNSKTKSFAKRCYYAVAEGREVGIYMSWESCSAQVTGFKGAVFKKFSSLEDARSFLVAHRLRTSASVGGNRSCTEISETSSISEQREELLNASLCLREGASSVMDTEIQRNLGEMAFEVRPPPMNSRKRARDLDIMSTLSSSPASAAAASTGSISSFACLNSPSPSFTSEGGGKNKRLVENCKRPCSDGVSSQTRQLLNHKSNYINVDTDDADENVEVVIETSKPVGTSALCGSSSFPPCTPSGTCCTTTTSETTSETWKTSPSMTSLTENMEMPPPPQEVFVDGACSFNGKGAAKAKGGYGVYYGFQDIRNVSQPLPSNEAQTNNRAELYATIYPLKAALDTQQKEEYAFMQEVIHALSLRGLTQESEELSRCCHQHYTSRSKGALTNEEGVPTSFSPFNAATLALPSSLLNPYNWWELKEKCRCYGERYKRSTGHPLPPFPSCAMLPQLLIYTDSKYVLNGLLDFCKSWTVKNYRLNGSGNKPVLNQDLWRYLVALRDAFNTLYYAQRQSLHPQASDKDSHLRENHNTGDNSSFNKSRNMKAKSDDHGNHDDHGSSFRSYSLPKVFTPFNTKNNPKEEGVVLFHVKGHSNNHGNIQADKLAVNGAKMRE